jgi:hypothetical protein
MKMIMTDVWTEIPEPFVQNNTGLKMLIKIQDTQPTTDDDAIVLPNTNTSFDGSLVNDPTVGTMWGRIDDDKYDDSKVYRIANY